MSRDGAIESVQQLNGMWSAILTDFNKPVEREAGLLRLWADSPFSFYNTLTIDAVPSSSADLEERLAAASRFLRGRSEPGLIWLFENLIAERDHADLPAILARAGLAVSLRCFGMAGRIPEMPEPTHPELRFERVRTQAHLDMYADLNAHAYGMPEEGARAALHSSRLWLGGIHAYLGFRDGEPVCCAGTYSVGDCLFVILVATEPAWHRHGFGEAVTRKAIWEGARATGLTRMTLHGTEAGRPVYERIGFEVTAPMQLCGLAG